MKKLLNWQILAALVLVFCSVGFYFLHYILFHDLHHIFLYLIGDVAFLFLDVLIVMLVLHRLLTLKEEKLIRKKLSMIIGVFFGEVGTELLRKLIGLDLGAAKIGGELRVTNNWSKKEYARALRAVEAYKSEIKINKDKLREIKAFLMARRGFMLNLLENPNLLEHESFTNLLWSVFHLTDELGHRVDIDHLPDNDYAHLTVDINRVYQLVLSQWIGHMRHLENDYPYLFSLAARTNPFTPDASVEIK
ncbi:hypothetical protein A3K48_03510 [candidate division WOR-1 bacterium RIFOXYA12_FULL_52_29]|uniref:Uncharacterized protein n=1 Tax=candidate division WOR-1 bacterium RIFOXYC12_FULL_54_18 TaxID=1802584 RepID=A0A1F4T6B3_UNCSA|nr:MAG: hypothetical protein A3K44_03510 [candidate division WOR-1 bacterium RIFOXYA2_FULL_51_19]OGC17632.1 MAG: hypothetical protein A3K48_03510 [candidate division WOR-1 bacterium RIFOXYA12_FULL_52_29]OGC26489.1 MAG: hypothetical protein A3K32_03505 [candidate division WOR-1 bacterium RIFOXYB2_FULL_45_9]OGC28049.1 MAG: hypothetical protein A3K49_03510 [candidate division WOR-1 bacterium RIFOXYC12_FULL_54_18]OGC29665.1 MAG: hypothetical protein A2346_02825 [candidate division WOR-1 bacterium R